MTPVRLEKETRLRATVRILGWILFVITGIALLTLSLLSGNKKTEKTGVVFTINSQPRVLPAIRFADAKERAMTLQDFRGKFVLLNVWATWCVPCRKEMPALDRLQAKLGGPGFEVVAISIDRDGLPAVQEFYLQTGIKQLRVYLDKSGEASANLGVVGLPTTLLIDRAGHELGRKIGPAEWDSPEVVTLIQGYLGAPAPDQRGQR
ncbi:MAG: TlpA family protein disulfide reductase [Betaproteobacteria bacterium]|nr:TlpA family protein disulfide reductase [Betaproteobacteria bacterium]